MPRAVAVPFHHPCCDLSAYLGRIDDSLQQHAICMRKGWKNDWRLDLTSEIDCAFALVPGLLLRAANPMFSDCQR